MLSLLVFALLLPTFAEVTTPSVAEAESVLFLHLQSETEFLAYDRLPPNNPYCRDDNGNLTRLVVDFPFVVDNCNDIKYNIINGDLFEGEGVYPLIQYHTSFNGYEVHIYN